MTDGPRDYLAGLRQLMPTGPVWPRHEGAVLAAVQQALADELGRMDLRLRSVLSEGDPRSTDELLEDWERLMDLPDPCLGAQVTKALRRATLVAKLTMLGGGSLPFWIEYAAALGFAPTEIQEYEAFVAGSHETGAGGHAGEAISNGEGGWIYAWTVHAPIWTAWFWRVGQNQCGDPLVDFAGSDVLECSLRRAAPAHTVVTFKYDLPADQSYAPWGLYIFPEACILKLDAGQVTLGL